MQSTSTYFTRRAGQERAKAAEAASAEARKAHMELALRLASLATDPVSWRASLRGLDATNAGAPRQPAVSRSQVRKVLVDAFSVPASGSFANLLQAIDESDGTTCGAGNPST